MKLQRGALPEDSGKGNDNTRIKRRSGRTSPHEPEGARRATSVKLATSRLQKDLCTGSISRDAVSFSPNSAGAEATFLRK